MERLPDQGPRSPKDDDARRPRVHPPLSHSRPTERLPSHSSLRFVRQRRPRAKHCPSAPVARDGRAGPFRPRRRQRSGRRPTRPFASMPVLWWPHDRSREVSTRRRSAPRFAKPDQNQLVMIENNLPATSQRRASPSLAVRQRESFAQRGFTTPTAAPETCHP